MASLIPKHVKKEITDGWVAETWKLMLLSNAFAPSADHQFISEVVNREITDPGAKYTAGGVAVAGKASLNDPDALNNYALDADDIVIGTGATLNYRYGVLYQDSGNQATSKIRAVIDFLVDQICVNGTSTIQWNALGIIYLT